MCLQSHAVNPFTIQSLLLPGLVRLGFEGGGGKKGTGEEKVLAGRLGSGSNWHKREGVCVCREYRHKDTRQLVSGFGNQKGNSPNLSL